MSARRKPLTRRAATAKGWQGPYRYHYDKAGHCAVTHGWIVRSGRKWLYFCTADGRRMRVRKSETRYMVAL